MRTILVLGLLLALVAVVPATTAHLAVRTCNTSTSCQDVASAPVPVDCHVDIVKQGLGKPPHVRVSDCA